MLARIPAQFRKIAWNGDEVLDVWNMVHKTPAFMAQIQKLQSMTMCKPFIVRIEGFPIELEEAMQYLAKTDWMKTVKDIFIWKICFGIVPYFEVPIDGTAHRVPKVPTFGTGQVVTYEDNDRQQIFEWEWFDKRKKNHTMFWLYTGYEPMLDGSLRSPAVSCLETYRACILAQRDALYASYHASHPMVVYEDHPSKLKRDDRFEFTEFDMFGEDALRLLDDEQEKSEAKTRYMRTEEVETHLWKAGLINNINIRRTQPVLLCNNPARDAQREKFVHNRIALPADRKYGGYVQHHVLLDQSKYEQRLAIQASEIVGLPLEMTQSQSKQHAANVKGMMTAVGETLKAQISWLEVALTRMYKNIYGETITQGWNLHRRNGDLRLHPPKNFRSQDARLRYEMHLAREVDIEIQLQCDPRVTESTIMYLYQHQFITKENAVEQLSKITGLAEGILEALPEPESVLEPVKKKLKPVSLDGE
jgi:hypothetical protein